MKTLGMLVCAFVLLTSPVRAADEHGKDHGASMGKGPMANPEMHEKMKKFFRSAREKHWAFEDKMWDEQKSFHDKTTKDYRDAMLKLESEMDANASKDHKAAMMEFRKKRGELMRENKKKVEDFKREQEKQRRDFRDQQRKERQEFFKANGMPMMHEHDDPGSQEE